MNFFRKNNNSSNAIGVSKSSDSTSPVATASNAFTFSSTTATSNDNNVSLKLSETSISAESDNAQQAKPNRRAALWIGTTPAQAILNEQQQLQQASSISSPKSSLYSPTNNLTKNVATDDRGKSSSESPSNYQHQSASPLNRKVLDNSDNIYKKSKANENDGSESLLNTDPNRIQSSNELIDALKADMNLLEDRLQGGPSLKKDELAELQKRVDEMRTIGESTHLRIGELFLEKMEAVISTQEMMEMALATGNLHELSSARDKAKEMGIKNDLANKVTEVANRAEEAIKQETNALLSLGTRQATPSPRRFGIIEKSEAFQASKSSLSPSKKRMSSYVPAVSASNQRTKQIKSGFIILSLFLQKYKPNRSSMLIHAFDKWILVAAMKRDSEKANAEKEKLLAEIHELTDRIKILENSSA